MNFLILLGIGFVVGWLASLVARTSGPPRLLRQVLAGVMGSLFGAVVAVLTVGAPEMTGERISVAAMALSLIGAIAGVVASNLILREAPARLDR